MHSDLCRAGPLLLQASLMIATIERRRKGNIFPEPFLSSWFSFYAIIFDSEITLIKKKCSLLHVLLLLSSYLGQWKWKRDTAPHSNLQCLSSESWGFELRPYSDYSQTGDSCAWQGSVPKANAKAHETKERKSTPTDLQIQSTACRVPLDHWLCLSS